MIYITESKVTVSSKKGSKLRTPPDTKIVSAHASASVSEGSSSATDDGDNTEKRSRVGAQMTKPALGLTRSRGLQKGPAVLTTDSGSFRIAVGAVAIAVGQPPLKVQVSGVLSQFDTFCRCA